MKVQTKFAISKNLINNYTGCLKGIKEDDLRRLILKLLIMNAIEEEFIKMQTGPTTSIIVYLRVGRNAIKVRNGKFKVIMSNGIDNT